MTSATDPHLYTPLQETFWLAHEILRQAWSINPGGMAVIGLSAPLDDNACGEADDEGRQGWTMPAVMHMTDNGSMLALHWMNAKDQAYTLDPVGYVLDSQHSHRWEALCMWFSKEEFLPFEQAELELWTTLRKLHVSTDSSQSETQSPEPDAQLS